MPTALMRLQNMGRSKQNRYLLLILLFLRFPLLFAAAFGIINETFGVSLYLCLTYLGSGLFLCLNRDTLHTYNFSGGALILFLIAPLLGIFANGSDFTCWLRLAMSVGFIVYLFHKGGVQLRQIPKQGIMANSLLTLIIAILAPLLFWTIGGFPQTGAEGSMLLSGLGFQLAFAAVSEEPLFRGFLWGSLKQHGLPDWLSGCLIALIFWLGHIYYWGSGLNFWLIQPLAALLLSFLVYKTKSVSYSMVAHTAFNALGELLRSA